MHKAACHVIKFAEGKNVIMQKRKNYTNGTHESLSLSLQQIKIGSPILELQVESALRSVAESRTTLYSSLLLTNNLFQLCSYTSWCSLFLEANLYSAVPALGFEGAAEILDASHPG